MGETVSEVQQLLQVPRLRGTIGEVWLEELLRQILPGHYEMQYQFRSGERVDAVLRLGERLVPVDAKFPLEACQRMLATSGPEQERERRAFARSLKDRIDEIADKYIRPDEGTYEFALMYIPAESVYYEAVMGRSVDPDDGGGVLGHAMQRGGGSRPRPAGPGTGRGRGFNLTETGQPGTPLSGTHPSATGEFPMQVFVTGATGYVGSSVATAFRRAGHHIWGLTRSQAKAR